MILLQTIRNASIALLFAVVLSSCGGGSCANCSTSTPGTLTLTIEAPSQYPAGLPESINAVLTMTNTSTTDANNLLYSVPAAGQVGNYTGVTITPNAGVGSASGACTNIKAGSSCTFTATIAPYANPGSFTVTAVPNSVSSTSIITKVMGKLLKNDSISVTANLGLVDTPTTDNKYYVLPDNQYINSSLDTTTTAYVSVWIKEADEGLNTLNLVDQDGTLLTATAIGTPTYATNSVNSYKITIPAGKSVQYVQALSNVCSEKNTGTNANTACSNSAVINLEPNGAGILSLQPTYFNMSISYESQVITLTNTGTGSITNIEYPEITSPFSITTNSCSNIESLAVGQSCSFTVTYNSVGVNGESQFVFTYKNGVSNVQQLTHATVVYSADSPGILAISPLSATNTLIGGSVKATVSLYGSVGVVTPVQVTITNNNSGVASITPANCALTSNNYACEVTLTGISLGNVTFTASASGYTSVTSPQLTVRPYQIMILGNSGAVDRFDSINNTYTNVLLPKLTSAVTYGAGTFVDGGDKGTLYKSTDGVNWREVSSSTIYRIMGVYYKQGKFFATGFNKTILTSPDGNSWTTVITSNPVQDNDYYNGLTEGAGGKLVAVGSQNGALIATSTNGGTTWVEQSQPAGASSQFTSVTNNGDFYVAVGYGNLIYKSTDATDGSWVQQVSPVSGEFTSIVYANGKFVAAGGTGQNSDYGYIMTSTDGENWTSRYTSQIDGSYLEDVNYANGKFIAVGHGSTILVSNDGETWTPSTNGIDPDEYFYGVTYGNGTYVVDNGYGVFYTSTNGVNWVRHEPYGPSSSMYGGATDGNGTLVVVGGAAVSTTKYPGDSWTFTNLKSDTVNASFNAIAYGGSRYVAVGGNSVFFISPDGYNWTQVNFAQSISTAYGVTYGNGKFVSVGSSGQILQSTDSTGETWNIVFTGTGTLRGVTYGANKFVAVGSTNNSTGVAYISDDGTNWQSVTGLNGAERLNAVNYMNGKFYAAGYNGNIYASSDGNIWSAVTSSGATTRLYGLGYYNGSYISVGYQGTLVTSSDGNIWSDPISTIWNGLQYNAVIGY